MEQAKRRLLPSNRRQQRQHEASKLSKLGANHRSILFVLILCSFWLWSQPATIYGPQNMVVDTNHPTKHTKSQRRNNPTRNDSRDSNSQETTIMTPIIQNMMLSTTAESSPPAEDHIATTNSNNSSLLTCKDMDQIRIIQEIGKAHHRTVYLVELPSGQQAVAKRCHEWSVCPNEMRKETMMMELLFREYGDQTIRYYGKCERSFSQKRYKRLKRISNFNFGYTMFIEIGNSTDLDIVDEKSEYEALDELSKQLAYLPEGPIVLGKPYQRTDLCFANEWARFPRSGHLRPIDLGNAHLMSDVMSRERALMINRCVALWHFAKFRFWENPTIMLSSSNFNEETCEKEYGAQCHW